MQPDYRSQFVENLAPVMGEQAVNYVKLIKANGVISATRQIVADLDDIAKEMMEDATNPESTKTVIKTFILGLLTTIFYLLKQENPRQCDPFIRELRYNKVPVKEIQELIDETINEVQALIQVQ